MGSVEGWIGSVEGWSGSVEIGTGDRPERAGGRFTATSCRDWRRGVATCRPLTTIQTILGVSEGLYWGERIGMG